MTSTFASLGLSDRISATVTALGYDSPTPIQEQAIPSVLAGKDLVGLAQTGTGKTAAFALPIIHKLAAIKRRGVRALIVAPTRELAQQIVEAIKKYSEGTGIKSTAIYGGVRMGSQLKRLRDGVDIVVGCPGRLVDHIQRRTLDLSQVETLVLDEADHMFDMGFLPDIRKLISFVPKKRQTLLFSATMPKEIRALAEDVLTDPQSIKVSNGEMAATVSHALFPVSADLKTQLLEKILKQFEVKSTIIFARTKQRTKRLADALQRNGYKVASLQGNLSQVRRQEAIKGFREGKFDVLVATDLAARGIDVQQVTHVINFDIPMTVEGYTHRIGRTGRAAREGEAFTLISREDEGKVRAIEKELGSKIERRRVDDFDYGKEAYSQNSPGGEMPQRSERRRPRSFDRGADKRPGNRRDSGRGFRERSERSDNFRPRASENNRAEGRERRFEAKPYGRNERPYRARTASAGPNRESPNRENRNATGDERNQRSDGAPRRNFDRQSYAKRRGFDGRDATPRSERRDERTHDPVRKFESNSERPARTDSSRRPDRPFKKPFARDRPAPGARSARPRGRFKNRSN